jgi:hypothetical protein
MKARGLTEIEDFGGNYEEFLERKGRASAKKN